MSGPISNAWCPCKKRKQRHTDRSKTTCDDRGRDSGNVVTDEAPPRLMALNRKPGETGAESPS